MLKAILAQENKEVAREKAAAVAAKLCEMKLSVAAKKVEDVAASDWGTKRYLNMDHLFQMELMNNTETAEASAG